MRFALVTTVAGSAWRGGLWAFEHGETAIYVLTGAALGVVLAWFAAEAARRVHDTGLSGALGFAILAAAVIPPIAITPTALAYNPHWLMPMLNALALLVAVILLFRPGARAANRFGEPPTGPLAHMPAPGGLRGGRAGVWTCVSVAGCALLALAIINISNGMRDAHAQDLRQEQERKP